MILYPGFVAVELEDGKDSFREINDCTAQAKLGCPVSLHE